MCPRHGWPQPVQRRVFLLLRPPISVWNVEIKVNSGSNQNLFLGGGFKYCSPRWEVLRVGEIEQIHKYSKSIKASPIMQHMAINTVESQKNLQKEHSHRLEDPRRCRWILGAEGFGVSRARRNSGRFGRPTFPGPNFLEADFSGAEILQGRIFLGRIDHCSPWTEDRCPGDSEARGHQRHQKTT